MALHEYPMISVEDYLTLDRASKDARYEYFDGELRMLAGGSNYHSTIMINLISILHGLLRGSSCRVHGSDMRVQLSKTRYVYLDATITCDQRDHEFSDILRHPRVVIEVLSPSTEATDRGKKFTLYRECPTVQEYVMVDAQSVQVEIYHRIDGKWTLSTFGPGNKVELESLNIRFPIEEVYEGLYLTQDSE
jgi:Uma2 family endonuclease